MKKRIILHSIGLLRNFYNRVKFGRKSPRFNQHVWIAPSVDKLYSGKLESHRKAILSGKVVTSSWPFEKTTPLSQRVKMQICHRRWVEGMSWKEAGAYEWMEKSLKRNGVIDGCRNKSDIVERYKTLDNVYLLAKEAGGFHERFFVNIHIGPDGTLFFGYGGGAHRLAIAHILKFPIQARIGLVHIDGFPRFFELQQRRKDFLSTRR